MKNLIFILGASLCGLGPWFAYAQGPLTIVYYMNERTTETQFQDFQDVVDSLRASPEGEYLVYVSHGKSPLVRKSGDELGTLFLDMRHQSMGTILPSREKSSLQKLLFQSQIPASRVSWYFFLPEDHFDALYRERPYIPFEIISEYRAFASNVFGFQDQIVIHGPSGREVPYYFSILFPTN